jgi:hypothetical protein
VPQPVLAVRRVFITVNQDLEAVVALLQHLAPVVILSKLLVAVRLVAVLPQVVLQSPPVQRFSSVTSELTLPNLASGLRVVHLT